MDIKEMKAALEEDAIQENLKAKYQLQVDAAEGFAKDMYKIVQGAPLDKKLREFLDSDDFVNTIYQIICHANMAVVDSLKHLSTKEDLKLLKRRKATTQEMLNICEKLRVGMQDILAHNPTIDYNTLLFQGLFVYYTDNLAHKLESHNQ